MPFLPQSSGQAMSKTAYKLMGSALISLMVNDGTTV